MKTEFCWTSDRQDLIGKLVRRLAFDFDAVSIAFRDHLTSEGVDFRPNATDPSSLRKIFAALDRERAAPAGESTINGYGQGQDNDAQGQCGLGDVSYGGCGGSVAKWASRDQHVDNPIQGAPCTHDSGLTAKGESTRSSFPGLDGVQRDSQEGCEAKASGRNEGTGEATAPPATDKSWSFDSFVEDQRRKEIQHDDQKEKLFLKVLSALGGIAEGPGPTAELPPDILRAWGERNDKLVAKAEEANRRRLKVEEDRKLALQRQSLKQRHLPGSADCVGDDPLALTTGYTTTMSAPEEDKELGTFLPRWHPCCRENQDEDAEGDSGAGASLARCGGTGVVGPVRLELGMDAETLEKILDEHEREFALAGGGYGETNSELSKVLDELDKAAARGGNSAPLLCDVRDQ